MNVKKGWPTLSIELLIILHFRKRKGVLERESENFTKIERIFKGNFEKSGWLFGGAFWQSLFGFSRLGWSICLLG